MGYPIDFNKLHGTWRLQYTSAPNVLILFQTAATLPFFQEPDGLVATIGITAATGLGVLAFSEVETILQLVGSAALVQIASKKLLFAEEFRSRDRTVIKLAGGGFTIDAPSNGFDGKITLSVVVTCIVVASSGLIFGYDIGISGVVTTMVPLLQKFFPDILRNAAGTEVNMYCVYDSQMLTLFTSSLYLAGLFSILLASKVTATIGRRNTIMLGGAIFFAGASTNGGSENISMLIVGRILLGFGVGFTNQATPLYLSEIALPKWRGASSTGFQFFAGIGVVAALCINYATAKHTWGWRLSWTSSGSCDRDDDWRVPHNGHA